jgi:hypothetical protein
MGFQQLFTVCASEGEWRHLFLGGISRIDVEAALNCQPSTSESVQHHPLIGVLMQRRLW